MESPLVSGHAVSTISFWLTFCYAEQKRWGWEVTRFETRTEWKTQTDTCYATDLSGLLDLSNVACYTIDAFLGPEYLIVQHSFECDR